MKHPETQARNLAILRDSKKLSISQLAKKYRLAKSTIDRILWMTRQRAHAARRERNKAILSDSKRMSHAQLAKKYSLSIHSIPTTLRRIRPKRHRYTIKTLEMLRENPHLLFDRIRKHKNGCWIFHSSKKNAFGYNLVRVGMGRFLAHRLAAWLVGKIPDPRVQPDVDRAHYFHYVLHQCDVPACINPAHLQAGTAAENTRQRFLRVGYRKTKKARG